MSLCLVCFCFFELKGFFVRLLSLFAPSDVSFNSLWQHQNAINSASALRRSSGKRAKCKLCPWTHGKNATRQTEHKKTTKNLWSQRKLDEKEAGLNRSGVGVYESEHLIWWFKESKSVCYNGTRRHAIHRFKIVCKITKVKKR